MAWTYILQCADGSYYVGSTNDIDARLHQHQNGTGANHTKRRRPVELVSAAELDTVDEAYAWEKRVQGWSRPKRAALIRGDCAALPVLAKKHWPEWDR